MVKLFQIQLEHYEKVQGDVLSLEGKANQLGQLVRANLPAAMQGFAVVPLFAGYDQHRERGRVFSYDVTGGRYEELDYQAPGFGQRARPQLDQGRLDATACRSTTPSTSRSARCSPPPTRTSPPAGPTSCAASSRRSRSIDADGYRALDRRRRRGTQPEPSSQGPRAGRCTSHEHAVLRLARTGDEGPRRLRAEGHRPRPQPRRARVRGRRAHRRRQPVAHAVEDQRDLRPHRVRGGRQVQRVPDAARRRRAPRRPQGLLVLTRRRVGRRSSPTRTRRRSARSSRTR